MTKQNIQELQDKYKRHNIQIIGIPEERKELKKKYLNQNDRSFQNQ